MKRGSGKRSSSAGREELEGVGDRQRKIEGYCSTDQSPQCAVVPMEGEEKIRVCTQSKKLISTANSKTKNWMGKRYTRKFKKHENKYLYKNASKVELNGRKQLRSQKPANSEILMPDDKEEDKGKEEGRKDVRSICSVHYEQLTVNSCSCHRLSTKVDVFQI